MTTLMMLALMAFVAQRVLRDGPGPMVRTVYVVVLFVAPIWMAKKFGVFDFDFRVAVVVAIAGATILRPFVGFTAPQLLLGDFLAVTLFLSDLATTVYWDDITVTTPIEGMRVWLWPYLMGRLLARSADDLEAAAKLLWWVGLGLGTYAVVEALTKTNPVNWFFGRSFWYLEQGEGYRWGLKRAQGPLEHPIHFGMMMVLLWPWTVQAMPKMGKRGWLAPVMVPLGVFVTVSRGAWVVGVLAFLAVVFFRKPGLRVPIACVVLAVGGGVVLAKDEVMAMLGQIIGEKKEQRYYVLIKGKLHEYSGTLHRQLLGDVYAEAVRGAGVLGYGAADNLRVPYPPATDDKFRSIDDYYMIVQLQYGSFGVFALLSTGLCGLAYLALTGWDPDGRLNLLAGGLFGACAGILIILNTVAFPPGFSGPFLFSMGVATGLERLRRIDQSKKVGVFDELPTRGSLRNLPRR